MDGPHGGSAIRDFPDRFFMLYCGETPVFPDKYVERGGFVQVHGYYCYELVCLRYVFVILSLNCCCIEGRDNERIC